MRCLPRCLYRLLFRLPGLQATICVLAAGLFALVLAARPAMAVSYALTDLGSLGGSRTIANGMNNRGEVVGLSSAGPGSDARLGGFLFDAGGMHDLGTLLGGAILQGSGINDAGQIVGAARFGSALDAPMHAFLYDGSLHDLMPTAAGRNSKAIAVNAQGHVTGWAETGEGGGQPAHAFLYDGTTARSLGAPGRRPRSEIVAALPGSTGAAGSGMISSRWPHFRKPSTPPRNTWRSTAQRSSRASTMRARSSPWRAAVRTMTRSL